MEAHGVPVGHGWENTTAEIQAREGFKGVDLDGFYDAFIQHVCCGEKSVRMYDVGSLIDSLRNDFAKATLPTRLPQPKRKAALFKANETDPELLCVVSKPDGLCGVFGAIRTHDQQTELKDDQVPEAVREALPSFDELIVVRASKFQSYGAIWLPAKGTVVEIRADHFVGHSLESALDFHQKLYEQLHAKSGSKAIVAPKDVFPAVKNLYGAVDEGIVMELAFATTTGSVKHERMRSKESLRKEVYHVGGKEALATDIEPFRLGVRWSREYLGTKRYNVPELHLEGSLSMVGSASAGLTKFTVRKAANEEDYNWVRDKLVEYL
ncbi:hypothetical protein [Mesorhizobium sp.]|uniref:hypothetical protein n=1 Tax=Mesorhizobium sp. TaxID=1871066 RepID=UPI000FE878EA|nr:hypothetical protein [Mesorhizobium sp.]RWN54141.1 MAG: hypothetical protein EOS00_29080 [Mesorhizobium sp.]